MKSYILKAFFCYLIFLFSHSLISQSVVDPVTFPSKTSPDGSEAIYTREDAVNRKVLLSNAKKYLTPDVQTTLIGYEPTATGNTLNLMEVVKHSTNSKIWYIDSNGDAFLLDDPNAGISDGDKVDITVSASGATWNIDADVVGATEISSSGVAAGSYGTASLVPAITVDEDGRVTNITTNAVSTTSLTVVELDLGNGCIVYGAGETTGWSFNKAAGVGTLTIPSGAALINVTIQGTSGDATYSAGSYSNAFKLKIIYPGSTLNLGYTTTLLKSGYVFDAANSGSITSSTPLVRDPGLVEISIDELSSGTVGYVFNSLNSYSAGWLIGF